MIADYTDFTIVLLNRIRNSYINDRTSLTLLEAIDDWPLLVLGSGHGGLRCARLPGRVKTERRGWRQMSVVNIAVGSLVGFAASMRM